LPFAGRRNGATNTDEERKKIRLKNGKENNPQKAAATKKKKAIGHQTIKKFEICINKP
jgi:hypothetical protein